MQICGCELILDQQRKSGGILTLTTAKSAMQKGASSNATDRYTTRRKKVSPLESAMACEFCRREPLLHHLSGGVPGMKEVVSDSSSRSFCRFCFGSSELRKATTTTTQTTTLIITPTQVRRPNRHFTAFPSLCYVHYYTLPLGFRIWRTRKVETSCRWEVRAPFSRLFLLRLTLQPHNNNKNMKRSSGTCAG